eukprot:TRINITY_DN16934_c0_g1_i10.p1 TRINITY_DN16934_c0_g1~~TRINITY_DN16934_c0_g1_i10.p1  ORF type:complete len:146 (-),score=21.61 TRINITY_DN16934_c0_g1_i10:327-764(-)
MEEALLREQERRMHENQKKKEEARKLREQEKLKGDKLKDHKDHKDHKEKPGLGDVRVTPSSKKDTTHSTLTTAMTSPPNNLNLNGPITTTTPTSQRVAVPKGEGSHTKRPVTTPERYYSLYFNYCYDIASKQSQSKRTYYYYNTN